MQISLSIGVLFGRFSFKNIFFALSTSDLIQAVFHFHKVKESILMYCRVWVFVFKIVKPLGHIPNSKKCGVSFSNLSAINLRFLFNPLNAFSTFTRPWSLTSNNVALHNEHRTLLFPLSLSYQLLLFHIPSY